MVKLQGRKGEKSGFVFAAEIAKVTNKDDSAYVFLDDDGAGLANNIL